MREKQSLALIVKKEENKGLAAATSLVPRLSSIVHYCP
jgi:hypothetical protein